MTGPASCSTCGVEASIASSWDMPLNMSYDELVRFNEQLEFDDEDDEDDC